MAVAAILDFQNSEFSTVGGFKRVEMCRLAKFGRNSGTVDMVIFRFFKMAAAAILDY